jgi:hypothetical protein
MDALIPIFGVMIPLAAIIGGITYQIFTRWQEGEERKYAAQSSAESAGLQRRVGALEDELALTRAELDNRSKDIDERLHRVEILLREVE